MLSVQTAEQILFNSEKLIIGMKKYKRIMDSLYWTDVSTNKDFQRTFNDFFVMRSRKAQYYERFYLFLEQKKDKGATFEETLDYLKEAEGQLELSFSSKLIHVINPNRPIWDKIVAENHFKMKLPGYGGDTSARQKEIIKLYHEYCNANQELKINVAKAVAIRPKICRSRPVVERTMEAVWIFVRWFNQLKKHSIG